MNKKKKSYRVRHRSIAWYAVRYKEVIFPLVFILAICLGLATASTWAKTADLSEGNTQGGQVIEKSERQAETAKESLYDVPLDGTLQKYIADVSKKNGVEPELVLAVIGIESNYNADSIGDGGESFGLMQIQTRWHQERIERLRCPDMLNPFDNVTVGVDILAECMHEGNGVEWALHCYNGGAEYADHMKATEQISEYTEAVLMLCEELKQDAIHE